MITTAQTLVSLACLISNKGAIDTTNIEAQLTDNEKILVQSVIESGSCLPQRLENLLERSKNSNLKDELMRHSPSEACFAG